MFPFPASMAPATNAFLLSLNALLVAPVFCHIFTKYCQDRFLSRLQAIARENKLGHFWCGASRKIIIGCTSQNNTDFFFLKHFTPETTSHLARVGFPFKSSNAFLPWHKRQMLKQLCSQETRTTARNHLAQHLRGMEPQFGMYIDIQRLVIIVEQ